MWCRCRPGSPASRVHGVLASIYKNAMKDRRVVASPCEGTRLPKEEPRRIVPLSTEQVEALIDALPERYRALAILGAGSGVRQGEAFGLSVDRVDFLRRTIRVDRQLVLVQGYEPFLAPPKTTKSHRSIPLPQVVVDALAAHIAAFPVEPVVIRVGGPDGPLETVSLIFVTPEARPIRRTRFSEIWRPAAKSAGLPLKAGFHALRHYYASLLIRHGESMKTVQERLGHATAAETLDTYSHLWPDSEDRTREAVDSILLASKQAEIQEQA